MKAAIYERFGGLAAIRLADIPIPQPIPGSVVVKVHAAGVNPVDIAVSEGKLQAMIPLDLPVTAGGELSGTISAVAADVSEWQIGDAVHALLGVAGAFAEYALVPAEMLVAKPLSMSFAEAATLPIAAATATAALDAGKVGQGTRLVIHAAAGGVGTVMVQLAKARGAHVTAMASPANCDYVAALGADEVVDRTGAAWRDIHDMDVVIDAFGTSAQDISWAMLRDGGVLVSVVSQPSVDEAERHGVTVHRVFGNRDPRVLRDADALFEAGHLQPHIARSFPFDQIIDALQLVQAGNSRGKLIVELVGGD